MLVRSLCCLMVLVVAVGWAGIRLRRRRGR
jgi:hypothetical protein